MSHDDFNVLEKRATELMTFGRPQDAIQIYYYMADGDPSLDGGYLGGKIAQCYEQMGHLYAAKYWYGRAVEENPEARHDCAEARRRLEAVVTIDDLVPDEREIAEAWIKYTRLSSGDRSARLAAIELFWVCKKLNELVRDRPENAWQVIRIMTSLDSSEIILANIAAGPLEDPLKHHGEKFIDRIEETTRSDPIFKKMLGAVWQNSIPQEVWDRVKAVAGPSF